MDSNIVQKRKKLCNEQWFYNRPLHAKQRSPPRRSLSPYLFIIALEILTIKIRNDDSIKGFKIGGETTKLSLFADDVPVFCVFHASVLLLIMNFVI